MTWEIALGIFALAAFLISVCGVIFKLSGILTRLQTMLDALQNILNDLKKSNAEEHKEFREKMELNERRITELEIKLHSQ